ncbi:MAG TPA: gluconokinase [Parafilimonas sp.]|nr:gluconokinase [Parafilimonas sp.]
MNLIAIDIGTTHCKAVIINEKARVLKTFQSTNKTITPRPGSNEQDAGAIFDDVAGLLCDSFAFCEQKNIGCVSFSAAMHSLIVVNKDGKPLTNMLTWADLRSASYAHELKVNPAAQKIYETTGVPLHAMSPLCKIIWLRNEAAEVFLNAFKFISIKEYVFFRLFGKYIVDHSIAAATGLLDEKKLDWHDEALQLAGINRSQLSALCPVGHYETELLPPVQKQLQIENTIPFVLGGSDGALANLGCGAIDAGSSAMTIGTSGAIRVITEKYSPDKKQRLFSYYLTDGMYLTGGAINNGGNVVKWFGENVLHENLDSEETFQSLLHDAMLLRAGAEGLLFLPYISGERSPVWDENARGAFVGLTSAHTRAHLTRAVIEGISFALFDVLKAVEETIGAIETIYLSGGVIKSDAWMQLLADITRKKVIVSDAADASALGAAFIGMKAIGILDDLKNVRRFLHEVKTFLPNLEQADRYSKYFELYRTLYLQLKATFETITKIQDC